MKPSPFLWLPLALLLVGCSAAKVPTLQVQRPAKIALDPKLKTLFILPDQIDGTNDQLGLKEQVLRALKAEIESQGRFRVVIGPVAGIDPNLEPVGVIQGSITSKEGSETGQFTELATCQGGLGGFAAGASAAAQGKQGVTLSGWGFLPCRSGNDSTSNMVAMGVGVLGKLAGREEVDPLVQVVRVYKYKNVNLFAQMDLTLTYLGSERKTLALRSDSANFSRHLVQPAINVHTSILTFAEALPLLALPVTPVVFRPIGIVESSNPGHPTGAWYADHTIVTEEMDKKEKAEVTRQLVTSSLKGFVQMISPHKQEVAAEIATGSSGEVDRLLRAGEWAEARRVLEQEGSERPADLYNLGLTYEALATSDGDYVQAQDLYQRALDQEENPIYAQGIGRMERRLGESRTLKLQQETKG